LGLLRGPLGSSAVIILLAQHRHVGGNDLCFVVGSPVRFPLASLQLAFDVDLLTFRQVLTTDLGELLPGNDVVPLGALLLIAALVLPGLIGCEA